MNCLKSKKIVSSRDHKILSGDHNFKDIAWTNCSTQPGIVNRLACDAFLESLAEHSLVQLNSEATREKSIPDLYFTNHPSLARHIAAVPGISDHDCAILADTYSPWARPPNFGYRYNLVWIILIVIFG